MTDEINEIRLSKTDDPETLEESLYEARAILVDVLEEVAQAAYVVGVVRGLLPLNAEGDAEFGEDDLRNAPNETLQAIAKAIDALYAAINTLPEIPEGEEGEDDGDDD